MDFIKNNYKDCDCDTSINLTVNFLIEINNIITGSNNSTLGKVNEKPYGFDKMYMDKELIEDKLYEITDQFNEIKTLQIFIQYS